MKKLMIATFLAAATLAFAACAGGDTAPTAPTGGGQAQQATAPAGDATEPTGGFLELTIHYHTDSFVFNDEWPAWQQAFEHTGVRLTGTANPVATSGVEQFNLEALNGFPADIYGGNNLGSLFMQFGMEGAFVPLTDLIPEHAPNFYRLLQENPMVRSAITAPDGNIYHFPTMPDGLYAGRTFFIRQDWLDLLGLGHPQTVQELEDTLIAFRDEIPALIGVEQVWPYMDDNWFFMMRLSNLWGARTYGHDSLHVRIAPREDNDELYHTWLDPQFMVALENISRWYGMGLIDEQVFTRGGPTRHELLSTNTGGMTYHFPVSTADFNTQLREVIDGFNFVPMAPPANIFGRRVSEHQRLPVQNNGWAISHNNQHVIETVRFMDFFYSDLGRTLMSYGAEGITFEFDANGQPQFLPYVFEQGITAVDVIRNEMGGLRFMGYMQLFQYEIDLATPEAQDAFAMMMSGDFAVRQLPVLNFNQQELDTINSIQKPLVMLDYHGSATDQTQIEIPTNKSLPNRTASGNVRLPTPCRICGIKYIVKAIAQR